MWVYVTGCMWLVSKPAAGYHSVFSTVHEHLTKIRWKCTLIMLWFIENIPGSLPVSQPPCVLEDVPILLPLQSKNGLFGLRRSHVAAKVPAVVRGGAERCVWDNLPGCPSTRARSPTTLSQGHNWDGLVLSPLWINVTSTQNLKHNFVRN